MEDCEGLENLRSPLQKLQQEPLQAAQLLPLRSAQLRTKLRRRNRCRRRRSLLQRLLRALRLRSTAGETFRVLERGARATGFEAREMRQRRRALRPERAALLIARFFLLSLFVLFCCILRKLGKKQNEHNNNNFNFNCIYFYIVFLL